MLGNQSARASIGWPEEVRGMLLPVLIAFALVCGLTAVAWCLFGALLLPLGRRSRPVTILYPVAGEPDALEQDVRAYAWLCQTGLVHGKLVILDCGLTEAGRAAAERMALQPGVTFGRMDSQIQRKERGEADGGECG